MVPPHGPNYICGWHDLRDVAFCEVIRRSTQAKRDVSAPECSRGKVVLQDQPSGGSQDAYIFARGIYLKMSPGFWLLEGSEVKLAHLHSLVTEDLAVVHSLT